ncbi:MAG: TolC family protein [Bacillota bacterium]
MTKKSNWLVIMITIVSLTLSFAPQITAEENQELELSLADSIRRGWEHNSQLEELRNKVEAAKERIEQSRSNKLPEINWESNYTRFDERRPLSNSGTSSKDSYNHTIDLNYLLYQPAVDLQIEQRKLNYEILQAEYEAQKRELAYQITENYYQALQAERLVKVNRESLAQVEKHLEDARTRFEAGAAVKNDVLQTEVRKNEVEQELLEAENNLDLTYERLKNLLELDYQTELELTTESNQLELEITPQSAFEFARTERADLRGVQQELDLAQQELKLAQADDAPALSLFGSVEKSGADFVPDGSPNWQTGVNLSWSLYDGGHNQALVQEAESNFNAAQSALDTLLEEIRLEVKESYLNLELSAKQRSTAQERVESAAENLRLARLRYQEGVGTNTEVIDAQVALTEAKENYQQQQYKYQINQAQMLSSLGLSYLEVDDKLVITDN